MRIWLSVMVYFLCLFPPLVVCFVGRRYQTREKIVMHLCAFLPTFLFAAFRASDVGTDTGMYEDYFAALEPREMFGLDPLYYLVQITMKQLGFGFHAFMAVQALFCWIGFSVGSARIDRAIPLMSVGILPVIMVDATFNGMRYGMAFAATAMLVPVLRSARPMLRTALAFVPGMIHSSMLVLMLSTWSGLILLALGAAVVALTPGLSHIIEYFFYKGAEYSEMERSSWLSGIVPVIQISIILWIAKINKVKISLGANLLSLALVLAFVSVIIGFYSMSALRFIQVALFLLAIAVSDATRPGEQTARSDAIVLFLGLLGVGNFLRQIFLVGPAGNVFFVPYNFY